LEPDERARAQRFRFERDRRRFMATRGILRLLLASYAGIAPGEVRFTYGAHGKPVLAGSASAQSLRFNLSHSRGVTLYAVTHGREIGVDIEFIRDLPDAEAIARRFFSPAEVTALLGLPDDLRRDAFFRCWTRKEAYIKAQGTGLTASLVRFSVSLVPDQPAQLLQVAGDPDAPSRWSLCDLPAIPGYAAALAAADRTWTLRCWRWTEGAHGTAMDLWAPR
jgi:4'-phosphopantetheinyl transferase